MKDLRGGIIRLYEQGKTGYEIAKEMKLGSKTVYRIIKRYQETGSYNVSLDSTLYFSLISRRSCSPGSSTSWFIIIASRFLITLDDSIDGLTTQFHLFSYFISGFSLLI